MMSLNWQRAILPKAARKDKSQLLWDLNSFNGVVAFYFPLSNEGSNIAKQLSWGKRGEDVSLRANNPSPSQIQPLPKSP